MNITPSDEEKLEFIVAALTHALIRNKFADKAVYIELAKRLAMLIDAEIAWQDSEKDKETFRRIWNASGLSN